MTIVDKELAGRPLLPTLVGERPAGRATATPAAEAAANPATADYAQLTLRRNAVRGTVIRQHILEVLLGSPHALSGAEIEQQMALDRVTVFRTLRVFEEKGIVHRIVDHSETVRYAAACPDAPVPALANDHVHFKCLNCRRIYCLNQVPVPAVAPPTAFRVLRGDHLLSGICGQCQPPGTDAPAAP